MQPFDLTEIYVYRTSKDLMYIKEKIEHYNIIQRCLAPILSQKKI